MVEIDELKQGDLIKVRVGNERLWFEVIAWTSTVGAHNALICRLDSRPFEEGTIFDGRVTIDREWIVETARRKTPPHLVIVDAHAS